jgi:phage terminase large subunit-like protein
MTTNTSALEHEINLRQERKNLLDFVRNEFPEYYLSHFHKDLIQKLQYFFDHPTGKRWNIAIIAAPPRHGKSHIVTEKVPVWLLGNHPRDEVIITAYGSDVAEQFGRTARDNYARVAPKVWPTAALDKNIQSAGHWQTELGGKCHSAGLLAPLTSYGANYLFIDDPIKNMEQADSDKIVEKIQTGLIPDVFSRVYPNGFVIIMATRWILNDPTGWVRENMREFINLDVNYPALCEDPETDPLHRQLDESLIGPHMGDDMALVPTKIAITTPIMQQQRATTLATPSGERYWRSLYQGDPTISGGGIVSIKHFKRINAKDAPLKDLEYNIMSIDTKLQSKDSGDPVGIQLWGYHKNNHYLLYIFNKATRFTSMIDKIKQIKDTFNKGVDSGQGYNVQIGIDEVDIESASSGPAAVDVLRQDNDFPPLVEIGANRATGGKEARAKAVAPFIERGNVYIVEDMCNALGETDPLSRHEDITPVQAFLTQWEKFPFFNHDEMVDCTTQYLARAHKLATGEDLRYERALVRYVHYTPMMWRLYERMSEEERVAFIKDVGTPDEWMPS